MTTKKDVEEMLEELGVEMWYHECKYNGPIWTDKNEHCNWCGINEEGDYD